MADKDGDDVFILEDVVAHDASVVGQIVISDKYVPGG
jgi:hypothetical protein